MDMVAHICSSSEKLRWRSARVWGQSGRQGETLPQKKQTKPTNIPTKQTPRQNNLNNWFSSSLTFLGWLPCTKHVQSSLSTRRRLQFLFLLLLLSLLPTPFFSSSLMIFLSFSSFPTSLFLLVIIITFVVVVIKVQKPTLASLGWRENKGEVTDSRQSGGQWNRDENPDSSTNSGDGRHFQPCSPWGGWLGHLLVASRSPPMVLGIALGAPTW